MEAAGASCSATKPTIMDERNDSNKDNTGNSCHDRIALEKMLLDDNFSIEMLIKQAQQNNMSLNELRDQLVNHKQKLDRASLELFDNYYDRFYTLSHVVACMGKPIQQVLNPLQLFRDRLASLCQNHDAYLDSINNKLDQLNETNRNKLFAIKLIKLIKNRNRIFRTIQSIEWLKTKQVRSSLNQPNDINYKVNRDTIERVLGELYFLFCEIRAIQPTSDELIPIKNLLESSVQEQRSHLEAWYEDVFKDSLTEQNTLKYPIILKTTNKREVF